MQRQFLLVTFLLACFFTPRFASAQVALQLVEGQPVNQSVGEFNYGAVTDCSTSFDFAWVLDSVLNPLATGLEVVVVIDSILAPPNSVYASGNPLAVGDTIRFDTSLSIPVNYFAGGSMKFDWRVFGTPTNVGEEYPCSLEVQATLGFCFNTIALIGYQVGDTCTVDVSNSVAPPRGTEWQISPVPAREVLRIAHPSGWLEWESVDLLDLQGRQIRHWQAGDRLEVLGIPAGSYFLRITSPEGLETRRILLE